MLYKITIYTPAKIISTSVNILPNPRKYHWNPCPEIADERPRGMSPIPNLPTKTPNKHQHLSKQLKRVKFMCFKKQFWNNLQPKSSSTSTPGNPSRTEAERRPENPHVNPNQNWTNQFFNFRQPTTAVRKREFLEFPALRGMKFWRSDQFKG